MQDQCGHKLEGDDEPGHSSINIKTHYWMKMDVFTLLNRKMSVTTVIYSTHPVIKISTSVIANRMKMKL